MIVDELNTIMNGYRYPLGSESRVYWLPEHLSQPFGEPCVIKIYTEDAISGNNEVIPLEELAKHEVTIANGLHQEGLGVPRMHETVLFNSLPEGHTHYIRGRSVPGLVMGMFNQTRAFEELDESEHSTAIGSFVSGIVTAMRAGYHPFCDTGHNKNVTYDLSGKVIFYDFSQWEDVGHLDANEIRRFFNEMGVLPKNILRSEGYLESIIWS